MLFRSMGGNVVNVSTDDQEDADLYGNATGDEKQKPSRLIIRDCDLINHAELLSKTEIPFTEGKTEVVIDRITSAASPRQIERVPAGAQFRLNLILNVWEQDGNETTLIDNVFKSLELLKDDYLGGSGSRGYGQVSIEIEKILEKTTDEYYGRQKGEIKDRTGEFSDRIHKLKN